MVPVSRYLRQFWCKDEAQDLVEYTIILAIFALGCFSVFGLLEPSIKGMWSTSGSELVTANSFAS